MSRTATWMKFAAADFRPVAAVMTTGLALSVILFLLARGYYFEAEKQQFQLDTSNYGTSFKSQVDRHINSLAAIRAFVRCKSVSARNRSERRSSAI